MCALYVFLCSYCVQYTSKIGIILFRENKKKHIPVTYQQAIYLLCEFLTEKWLQDMNEWKYNVLSY